MDLEWKPTEVDGWYLAALLNISADPTTSEEIQIIITDEEDENFDTVLDARDPTIKSVQNVAFSEYRAFPVPIGMGVKVSYPNTDGNTVRVTLFTTESIV